MIHVVAFATPCLEWGVGCLSLILVLIVSVELQLVGCLLPTEKKDYLAVRWDQGGLRAEYSSFQGSPPSQPS